MIVVSDTTAITSLIQIGRVNLLAQIYGEVLIPEAVQSELSVLHPKLPDFIRVQKISNQNHYHRLMNLLDEGEAEAIVLAKEISAETVLMDEADGRRVALAEGLHIVGTLGVLIEAKQRGLIHSVREVTGELENTATFHVSDTVKEIIFRAAGEL